MPSPLERAWLTADRNPCSIPESSLCTGSQASLSKPGVVPNSQSLSSQITSTCVYTPKKEAFYVKFSRGPRAWPCSSSDQSLKRSPYSTVSRCCIPHKVQDWKTLFMLYALDTRSQKSSHVLENVRLNVKHEARTAPRHAHSEIPESML